MLRLIDRDGWQKDVPANPTLEYVRYLRRRDEACSAITSRSELPFLSSTADEVLFRRQIMLHPNGEREAVFMECDADGNLLADHAHLGTANRGADPEGVALLKARQAVAAAWSVLDGTERYGELLVAAKIAAGELTEMDGAAAVARVAPAVHMCIDVFSSAPMHEFAFYEPLAPGLTAAAMAIRRAPPRNERWMERDQFADAAAFEGRTRGRTR